ncbi:MULTISPECIES: HlyU family transcriptional regulator [unclassified Agarivorans]|uniref:HlyU family transcriptional regulator n=1 Tax=unclassified Agarivorans TaxID=2636026 RepID=UPI0026E1A50A|nr:MULTISPECIES: HlyU family transcriptional regulator [unclassified Agarivorans]MDO6687794.1 HlyU family transcriptional regulator [Agarivorans sp. 3_MG-2023]MDO6717342.1 HlyU family transcriptional regulator [Agarivorans sp. 2_MG-2023]MDO6765871.1 HlyU family transcriptional regulator [Agarivorans sp. 1_MG-2023]
MSIFSALKKMFQAAPVQAKSYPEELYNEFTITPSPQSSNGQYRVAAVISKTINGELKEHTFIRSDTCASSDDAAELAMHKCKTFIDQMGDQIFD